MRQAATYNCDPAKVTDGRFYVGLNGLLPKIGDPVIIKDFLHETEIEAMVVKTLPDTMEYSVTLVGQLPLFVSMPQQKERK